MTFYKTYFLVLTFLSPTGAFPPSASDLGSRTRRDDHCREEQEYLYGNLCCLNCPAGTHVKSHCSKTGERSKCQECDYGTYTEHSNGLNQCFKCTKCRSDQEIVRQCVSTQDTECQCKAGRFCDPNQACEVCKKCLKCKRDEVMFRNCTATTDTECKKIKPSAGSASANLEVILPSVIIPILLLGLLCIICFLRRHRASDTQGDLSEGTKFGQYSSEEKRNGERQVLSSSNWPLVRAISSVCTEEERAALCESLSSSASNSQHSLTAFTSAPPVIPLHASPVCVQQPDIRRDDPFPKLVPVNGEESLRKCFEYFEEIDMRCHKRFFRQLDLSDNVIQCKEPLTYEDKIHELLNIWVESRGREASLNELLRALLDLKQRRTAEIIRRRAVESGHYVCER